MGHQPIAPASVPAHLLPRGYLPLGVLLGAVAVTFVRPGAEGPFSTPGIGVPLASTSTSPGCP
jgi:hypothetical protein